MWRLLCAAIFSASLADPPIINEDPWRASGTFGNDTWLPRDVELERQIAFGDEIRSEAAADQKLEEIFKQWGAALKTGSPESWVRWDTRLHWESAETEPALWSERRVEGLANAILLRLIQNERELLLPWSHFNAAQADAELAAVRALPIERQQGPLAALCSRYPGTHASVRSALLLNELESELNRPHHARAWQRQAEQGATLLNDGRLIAAAAARAEESAPITYESWETADEWEVVDFAVLTKDTSSAASGVRGMTRWNETQVFIQSAELGWTLKERGKGSAFALEELARLSGQPLARGWKRPGSAWRHRPSSKGELAFSVLGRVRDVRSNALFAFRPGAPPAPRWSLGEGGWRDASGAALASLENAIGAGAWEFQPCPLAVDDLLIVQARRWDLSDKGDSSLLLNFARPEAVALALDLETGELVWKRSLARGSDLLPGEGERFAATRTPAISAPSPVLCGTSLVFATGLGACATLDLAEGRPLRAVLGQRASKGFKYAPEPSPAAETSVLWAPFGGKSVYELLLGSLHPELESSPFAQDPALSSEWSSIIGSYEDSPLIALSRGGRDQIEHHGRADRSIQLSLGETLVGAHQLGSERLLSASDRGLFIFDLTRGLYLVGHTPLDPSVQCLPQGLVAADSRAWILTEEGVYRLRVKSKD
jgi:hypothetical protein